MPGTLNLVPTTGSHPQPAAAVFSRNSNLRQDTLPPRTSRPVRTRMQYSSIGMSNYMRPLTNITRFILFLSLDHHMVRIEARWVMTPMRYFSPTRGSCRTQLRSLTSSCNSELMCPDLVSNLPIWMCRMCGIS